MTEALVLDSSGFIDLSYNELLSLDGGIADWDRFMTGLAIFGGGVIAVTAAPALISMGAVAVTVLCAGIFITGVAAGYNMGAGIYGS